MSRINDIIDLTQDTNDFYLVNPTRYVRSVYIQIDNICELTMKSFLQIETGRRQNQFQQALIQAGLCNSNAHRASLRRFFSGEIDNAHLAQALGCQNGANQVTFQNTITNHQDLQHWSAVDGAARKTFEDVLEEIKDLRQIQADGTNNDLHNALDRFLARHQKRNAFFHNQHNAGLTIREDECLEAFIDLFWLCSNLFGNEYDEIIIANDVIHSQIAVIKIRRFAIQRQRVMEIYQDVLRGKGELRLRANSLAHEFCILHEDAGYFLQSLQKHIQTLISREESEINRINNLTRIDANNREKVLRGTDIIDFYKAILRDCLNIEA